MLILLPPSEGKSALRRGKPLDLGSLSFPSLHAAVSLLLLIAICILWHRSESQTERRVDTRQPSSLDREPVVVLLGRE